MFNAWRYPSQNKKSSDNPKPEEAKDDAQVSQLRKMLEDLRGGLIDSHHDGQATVVDPAPLEIHDVPHSPSDELPGAELPATADVTKIVIADPELDRLTAAQRLVAEQRKAAEAMLQEVEAFEERLRAETLIAEASHALSAADAKMETLRAAEQQAHAAFEALRTRHEELQGKESESEAALHAARAQHDDAETETAELEGRLREAHQRTHEAAARVERAEAEIAEVASEKAATEEGIAAAREHLEAQRLQAQEAHAEADAARERFSGLTASGVSSESSGEPFVVLQRLSLRLAEEASAMATVSEKKKTPKLLI